MTETIAGIVAAVLIIFISRALSKYFSVKLFAATLLVAIAFIYVGFSLKGNSAGFVVLESVVALIFYFMALIGYRSNNLLIAMGIILHGVWDISHHNGFLIRTDVPLYWPAFCMVIDVIDGIYFFIVFNRKS